MVIREYPSSDLISVLWFYFYERKSGNEQTFKLNFWLVKKDTKIRFAEASDGEKSKLVDHAGNKKKSTKYALNVFELSFLFCINKQKVSYIFCDKVYLPSYYGI